MSSIDFREAVKVDEPHEIVEQWILSPGAKHIDDESIEYIRERLSATFGLPTDAVSIKIVGSAKLGFSISNKSHEKKYRYRLFSDESDIDVAVISQRLYYMIWNELSEYAHRKGEFPWRDTELGSYMLYGWLRPDHFPPGTSVPLCRKWWALFEDLSSDPRFGRRKVRGALYFIKRFVVAYQERAVRECREQELL